MKNKRNIFNDLLFDLKRSVFHNFLSFNFRLLKNLTIIDSSISFYKYAHKKGKPVIVPFSYYQLLNKGVIEVIKERIQEGFCYTGIIRVRCGPSFKYYIYFKIIFVYLHNNTYHI